MAYYRRKIDADLQAWSKSERRKPLLIRGARQVGKSSAVRELGKTFKHFVEINLEKQPDIASLFTENINVRKTCQNLSAVLSKPIIPGETLLFVDEIQVSKEAIMALRYFKEDYPELHVIAAGSLLEFALEELPSFGVGRIRSLYLYPFSFDEFLYAQGLDLQVDAKRGAMADAPLIDALHKKMIEQLRTFYLVGGMPAAVTEWIETKDYREVTHVHNDILDTYQDDFSKYKKRVSPSLLRQVLRSVALQVGNKFVMSQAVSDVHSSVVRDALRLLSLAGLIVPVTHTDGNGIPLGAEANDKYVKYLFMDQGLMQTMLNIPASDILLSSEQDLVNKGPFSEMFAGLELMKYSDCLRKSELYYWQHMSKNGKAEVDYLVPMNGQVLPVEVKASTKGSMQSLYLFMRKRHLEHAVRMSLENFGRFEYDDPEVENEIRHVDVIPLYALSNL